MTTIDYKSQVAAQVEQNAAEQKAAVNESAWQEIIDKYAIRDHQANRRMVGDFCNGTVTLVKFKFLVDNPPQGFQLDWSDEKTLKAELVEAILAALHDPSQMRFTDANVKNERVRMQSWTLRMLRDRLSEIVNGQYFGKFSASELRAGLAKHRKSQLPKFAGYDDMPSVLVPKGFVSAVSTKEYLLWCTRNDIASFRRMVARYGSEQVNSVLNS